MNLGDFLSPQAGQQRTAWLHGQLGKAGDAIGGVIGPELSEAGRKALMLGDYLNPLNLIFQNMQNTTPDNMQRIMEALRAMSGTELRK